MKADALTFGILIVRGDVLIVRTVYSFGHDEFSHIRSVHIDDLHVPILISLVVDHITVQLRREEEAIYSSS